MNSRYPSTLENLGVESALVEFWKPGVNGAWDSYMGLVKDIEWFRAVSALVEGGEIPDLTLVDESGVVISKTCRITYGLNEGLGMTPFVLCAVSG